MMDLVPASTALVWTFQLVGGDPFSIQVPNNPVAEHSGGLSIWHLRVNPVQAEEIEKLATGFKARVTRHCETETADQSEMHRRFFESKESLFQCSQCVDCYWLDLQAEGYCGAESWDPERRKAAFVAFEQAQRDLESCPVREPA